MTVRRTTVTGCQLSIAASLSVRHTRSSLPSAVAETEFESLAFRRLSYCPRITCPSGPQRPAGRRVACHC
eukprot:656688-Hanusia_phi.AAC.1